MTLAGGCVAGSLYKAASGNVNSKASLAGIRLGALAARHGPLRPARGALEELVWKAPDGGALTLPAMTGLAPWQLALLFAFATLALVWWRKRGRGGRLVRRSPAARRAPSVRRVWQRPWRSWQAGLALGLLACLAYPSSEASGRQYPLGVTTGVVQSELLLIDSDFWTRAGDDVGSPTPGDVIVWWEVLLVLGLFAGAWISARLSRDPLLPRPPEQTIVAFFGGCLTGLGATIGLGCTIGHIVSGWALMSVGSLLFGTALILSAWVTTCAYLMGGIPWGRASSPQ
jgi:hypothetical protein